MSAMFSVCSQSEDMRLDMQNHRTALLNSPDQRLKKAGQEQSKYLREKLLEGVSLLAQKFDFDQFCVCNSALISPIWKHFYLCIFLAFSLSWYYGIV